jgi:hypothetical protein
MSIGASILVMALGAVLRYAIHVHGGVIDLGIIGVILMIAGAASVLLRLLFRPNSNPDSPMYPSSLADDRVVETPPQPEVIVEEVPVVRHHYAEDPDEPHLYSLAGRAVGSRKSVRVRNRRRVVG